MTIQVAAADRIRAERVVGRFTRAERIQAAGSSVMFLIPNRQGLEGEAHPFARELLVALQWAGVTSAPSPSDSVPLTVRSHRGR